MKVKLFDTKGNKTGEMTLDKSVFGVKPNLETLKQYLYIYVTNQRQGTSSTKTRGEVTGSSAKPWAQKGTGRARAGEKRNPIWRHGGIAFGPKPKDWRIKMSRSIRDSAFISALSLLAQKGKLSTVEKLDFDKISTKHAVDFVSAAGLHGKTLFIINENDPKVVKSFRNIEDVSTALVANVNVYEMLNTENVVIDKSAVETLQTKLRVGDK